MKHNPFAFFAIPLFFSFVIAGCQKKQQVTEFQLSSPNGKLEVTVSLNERGEPLYAVQYDGQSVITPSGLGMELQGQKPLKSGFEVVEVREEAIEERWTMPWGEQREVENDYAHLMLGLRETEMPRRILNLHFKAYDEGVAFRYEIPEQEGLDTVIITDEHSEFGLTGNHTCWWIPGDWDIYEHNYQETPFLEIDAVAMNGNTNLAQTYIPENAVNTPVTMRTESGLHLSFHEANLTDYPGMTLKVDTENMAWVSELVGSERTGYKALKVVPFVTPWRTVQIAERAGDLIESTLILNLNEPNQLGDVSYVKPMKYMGIWWGMHLGKNSWDTWQKDADGYPLEGKPYNGTHGATTEEAKRYIDFASAHGIGGLLVEGWNVGWERWIGFDDREGVFDFVTPYPDYDIEEVVRYGKEKGVEIIMHHETSAAVTTYDEQLDTAFALMQALGLHAVKTGYVGKIIPRGEYHHGQWMVNHYRRVLDTAAKYGVAVNAHEPIKATGIRRTYPNAIAREGLRGQEFNAWSSEGGNKVDHPVTVAFTRMLAGPIDYTPGVFNLMLDGYKENNRVRSTLAQQLALYVVFYSPIQMACDLPEHYLTESGETHPMFAFIEEVAVDWEESRVINGEVGDFVTITRHERNGDRWFLGSITDENARNLTVSLDFLDPEQSYTATIYADGDGADWESNPYSWSIDSISVSAVDSLQIRLAPGGGQAVVFEPRL